MKTIEEEFPPEDTFLYDYQLTAAYTALRARAVETESELATKDAHADEIYKAAVNLAAKLEDDLEQERQDRKQADLDCLRALGERNDERALADRLAYAAIDLRQLLRAHGQGCGTGREDVAAWKEARK